MGDLSEHFSRVEVACRDGCGKDTIDADTLRVLEQVRTHFDAPVRVHSGYRCPGRNKVVGGASNSQHLYGRAADISISGVKPATIAQYLDNGPLEGRGGIGVYNTFVHIDTRSGPRARWTQKDTD